MNAPPVVHGWRQIAHSLRLTGFWEGVGRICGEDGRVRSRLLERE